MRSSWVFATGALALACGSSTGGTVSQAGGGGASGAGGSTGGVAGASGGTAGVVGAGAGGPGTGGGAAGGAGAGGGGGAAGGASVLTGTRALLGLGMNDRCMPSSVSLPTTGGAASLAACRVVLTGVVGGCSQLGLSTATAQDKASVLAAALASGAQSIHDPVCQVGQVNAHTGSGCAAASASGWCYVDGACTDVGLACNHAVCATPAFNQLMLAYDLPSWMVCD
jgi:hypothetical protein